MERHIQILKEEELVRIKDVNLRFAGERQAMQSQMERLQTHFEQEVLVRDTLNGKLSWQIEELQGQLQQTLSVLKIPRLTEIARRRFNFTKFEITKEVVSGAAKRLSSSRGSLKRT